MIIRRIKKVCEKLLENKDGVVSVVVRDQYILLKSFYWDVVGEIINIKFGTPFV